jgi:hypothetical protein
MDIREAWSSDECAMSHVFRSWRVEKLDLAAVCGLEQPQPTSQPINLVVLTRANQFDADYLLHIVHRVEDAISPVV